MRFNYPVIFAIWLTQLVNYMDRVVLGFAGPSMMKYFDIDTGTFGIVLSSFALGYILSQIPGGILADRFGARALMVIGPLIWAVLTGLTGLITTVGVLIVVRLLFGASEGLSNASSYKVVGDNFLSEDRARAVSYWATAFALAPALVGPFVGLLLTDFPWQAVFFMLAFPPLIAAAVNYWLLPARGAAVSHAAPHAAEPGSFRSVLGHRSLWLIAGAYMFFNVAYWGLLGWMPSYLALERHIDIKASGMLSGLPYVFALVGLVVIGWLATKPLLRYRPQCLAACYVLGGVSLYLAYTAESLTMSLAGLSCGAFFIYGSFGPFGAIVLDLAPDKTRAAYSGVVSTLGQIGGLLAPVVIGYLVKATGTFASGFAFMAISLCLGAACVVALMPLLSASRSQLVARPAMGA